MKNLKKVITVGTLVLAIGVTSATGFAASAYNTPAETVAGLTGQTVENVVAQRQETNKTYGAIAAEAGKLEEFKKENFEMKKDSLNAQVKEGRITQEKADGIIKAIEENQVNCDGTGSKGIGQREGARFASNGLGQGLGNEAKPRQGRGQGEVKGQGNKGQGQGRGQGGMRLQDGTCYTPAE